MNKFMRGALAATFLGLAATQANATIYVTQVGDGAAALTNGSTALSVLKFANDGTPDVPGTIALPTAASGANQPFSIAGTPTSEGFLTLSANGQYLTVAGYAVSPGTPAVASTASTAVPRAVARIAVSNGAVDTTTSFPGTGEAYTGGNPRSAVSNDGTSFWMSGSVQGIRYATLGATTSTLVSSTVTNTRVANIFNNQLYVSSGSGAFVGVNAVGTGLPTGSGETTAISVSTAGTGTGTASPYDFWFKDANTLYVADDRSLANGGGIQKWAFDTMASTWSLQYTLSVGSGARGLAATVDDSNNAVLYATTFGNTLATVTDTGASSVFSVLATAPTNTAFRGVEFVADGVGPAINANFDGVGGVNGNDFLIWQQNLGISSGATLAQGDSDGNGTVDATDLANWKTQFGTPAVAAVGAVPEPGTFALAGAALAGALGVARRRAGR
jgi:hypothetical protein